MKPMMVGIVAGVSTMVGIVIGVSAGLANCVNTKAAMVEPAMPPTLPPGYRVGPTGVILHIVVPEEGR